MCKKFILCLLMPLCLFFSTITVAASETAKSEYTIEELEKQIEELTKQLNELKAAEGSSTEESLPETSLSEDVANADTTIEYTDIATVQMVQIALNEAGFNCGSADGKAGPKTKEQITLYQTANNLTVNGLVTEQLITSLGLADKVEERAKLEAEKATYSGDYSYEQLARTPDTYKGVKVKFSGKVVQTMEDTESGLGALRISVNSNHDVVYGLYAINTLDFRILEDDNVTIYGTSGGMYSYTAVRGNTVTSLWS